MPSVQDVFQCDHPVALVTGSGAPRVGRSIALHFAQLGCRISLHANTHLSGAEQVATSIRRDLDREVIVTSGSLREPDVPERLVRETVDAFGRIDVLVNSAAIWTPTKLESITGDEILDYFQVNSIASFLCARAAGMQMVDQACGGSIINVGDWATVRPYLDHAAYFPSKGAIEVMTRSLAVELGHRNPKVRVNCIQPGPVMLAEDVTTEYSKRMASSTLVGRVGTPEHVAHAAQFLCENDFVTGVCLPVDGGRSIYAPDGIQSGLNSG